MLRRSVTMVLPRAHISTRTIVVRHAHTAKQLHYQPVKVVSNVKLTRSLRDGVRKHNPGAVWNAYVALNDSNQLDKLPMEYHSMALQSFRLKKLVAYGPEEIETIKERLLYVWNNMQQTGHNPDVRDYNHIIDFFGRAGDWEACTQYFEELNNQKPRTTLWSKGLQPTVYSYNILMRAAIASNHAEQVFVYLNKMKTAGIQPNAFTYDVLIEAHGHLGNSKGADRVFQERYGPKEIKEVAKPVKKSRFALLLSSYSTPPAANPDVLGTLIRQSSPSEIPKPKPSTHTFVALLDAHGRKGHVDSLDYIYHKMMPAYNVKPDLELYNTMIRWHCEHRNVDKARRVFFDLERSGLKPSVVTFNYLFRHEALREGNPRTAESLLKFMDNMYNLQPLQSMYRALIKAYNKRNLDEDADRLFREYVSREPSQR